MDTENAIKVFVGAKSICKCGHLGDGSYSDHEDLINKGHGRCKVCDCEMFVWKKSTPSFNEIIDKIKGKVNENNLESNC